MSAESLARDFPVVEGNGAVGELLALLVALACDDHDIPLPRPLERRRDGRRAVRLRFRLAGHSRDDLVDDRLRILAPRVVRRDDGRVGEAGGDFAHQRALRLVTVPAAPEKPTEGPGA